MRTRDLLLSFVTCVVLASTNTFLSCATQQAEDDEDLSAFSEGESGSASDSDENELGELPPNEEMTSSTKLAATPSDNEEPLAANQSETPTADALPDTTNADRSSAFNGSHLPTIPARAVQRAGTSLNRFYFARQGDSASSVATLIYGDAKRATDLGKWNSSFAPGRVVYYRSASQPDDGSMRSFYQERSVPAESYEVKKGDWLSRLAATRLGSSASWKEIAITSGVDAPDKIEVGQKLQVYPRDLSNFSDSGSNSYAQAAQAVAPAANPSAAKPSPYARVEAPTPAPAVEAAIPDAVVPDVGGAATAPGVQPPTVAEGFTKESSGGSLDPMQIVEQNLYPIVIFAGLAVLLLAYVAVMRRRRMQDGELSEPMPSPARASKRRV